MERRRRVKDREDDEPVRGLAWLAVDPRDGLPDEELSHRMAAQRDDDPRSKDLEMPAKPDIASRDLIGKWIAVLRRPVPHDVGDEHLAAVETDAGQQLVEELAGGADERLSLDIFVVSGRLAEEKDPRLSGTLAGHGLAGASVEGTRHACANLFGDEA